MMHPADLPSDYPRTQGDLLLRDQDRIDDERWTRLERTGVILGMAIISLVAFFALLAGLVWLFMP